LIPIIAILSGTAIILLRPLSKQLGELLEAMVAERRMPVAPAELMRLRDALELQATRIDELEERQQFTDKLLQGQSRQPLLEVSDKQHS
jgi:hypothetical protein